LVSLRLLFCLTRNIAAMKFFQFLEANMASEFFLHAIEDAGHPLLKQGSQKQRASKRVRARVTDRRSLLMKTYLFGLIAFAGGLQVVAVIDADPDFRIFAYCVGGGVLGVAVGCGAFPPKSLGALGQESCGNLSAAVAFGPSLTPWVAARFGFEPNFQFYMAVSAVLGITGIALVKAVRSEFISVVLMQLGFKKKPEDT
jgi:hypothetical protein